MRCFRFLLLAASIGILPATPAMAQLSTLRITEAMSSSGVGGTADWWEVTNFGGSAVDITGWKMDDSSYAFGSSVALNGVTSIGAGESVVFIETAAPLTDIPNFRTFWGGSANVAAIGSYTGSGVSLSSAGDGIVRVSRETQGRKGKGVTVVRGLGLDAQALAELGRELKAACGSGGTVKDGVIEIQGEHRDRIVLRLQAAGMTVKRVGG
jgi:predicted translation initiation factor SUI1